MNPKPIQRTLLVIDYSTDWTKVFKNAHLKDGEAVRVEQCEWKDLHVEASSETKDGSRCRCWIKRAEEPLNQGQKEDRVVIPHFVLFRNFPRSLHNSDYRINLWSADKNLVIGFQFACIPAVNSVSSVLRAMDRPVVYGELLKLRDRLGADKFPLIPMQYHPNLVHGTMKALIDVPFPCVVKVGSTHAGFGKMLCQNESDYKDCESVLALSNEYYTTEKLIDEVVEEIRIQKIGDFYRAYHRRSSSGWKGNWGDIKFADCEMLPRYKEWADEVAKMFEGLDIFAIDVLKTNNGKEWILEVNDSACGLMWAHESEDLQRIRDHVIHRMNDEFCKYL